MLNSENGHNNKDKSKLSDSVFFQGIFVCIINIVLCLVCLSTASWAWFYDSQTVSGTTLRVTEYDLTVNIYLEDNTELLPDSNGIYSFEANKVYSAVFTPIGSSGNGYAIICINELTPIYTDLIPITEYHVPFVIKFEPLVDSEVKFDLRWGTTDETHQTGNGDTITVTEQSHEIVKSTENIIY